MEHSFNIYIAKKYGVNSAVLLKNIHFWIEKNRANNKNFYDDNYWTYNSKSAFAELFPYMNARQIDYALKKLIDDGLLITGNYNKVAYDRTLWYAITKLGYSILQNCNMVEQNCEMEETKLSNGKAEIVEPIPNIKTNNNQNNKTSDNNSGICIYSEQGNEDDVEELKNKKFTIGEYKNVKLSNNEICKLNTEYGEELTKKAIEHLSEYIEMKGGYKVKSHYLAIRRWVISAVEKEVKTKSTNTSSVEEPAKDTYGKYANVFLTGEEYEKLIELNKTSDNVIENLNNVEEMINFLSDYLYANPQKKYASHFNALTSWVTTALKERELKEQALKLKEIELQQRQERIDRIAESNDKFTMPNGKRISDMTHDEYLKSVQDKTPVEMYNWLEN